MTEIEIVTECWRTLQEYIPTKDKQIAADHFIGSVVDFDLPDSEFIALVKSDQYLEEAASDYLDHDDDELEHDEW